MRQSGHIRVVDPAGNGCGKLYHDFSQEPETRRIHRIGVLRVLQLGDLLLSVPALRALRAGFPRAEITLIGLPWAEAFVHRFSQYVDRFVALPGYRGIAEAPVESEGSRQFIWEQRAYAYDLVIQMHGSGRTSNACALALGGRMTAGYYDGARPDGLDPAAPYPSSEHEILRNLRLASLVGCRPVRGTELEFPLTRADRHEAQTWLNHHQVETDRPIVAMHVGARATARRWPAERFAIVADHMARHFDAQIVLTGSRDEIETVQTVAKAMTAPSINLAGETSLGGLAGLIRDSDLFISNDTGPAHLAVALDTPSVTIFGPADPRRWAPLDRVRHPIVRHTFAGGPSAQGTDRLDVLEGDESAGRRDRSVGRRDKSVGRRDKSASLQGGGLLGISTEMVIGVATRLLGAEAQPRGVRCTA